MNAEHVLSHVLIHGGAVTPMAAAAAEEPRARRMLYKALLDQPRRPFHQLLRHLLQQEASYRKALRHGEVEADGSFYAGIYRCAFLLAGCADPSDTLLLWKAKHVELDVSTSLGAEYFVGAGVDETLRFLERCDAQDAQQILAYVTGWFSRPEAVQGQQDWALARAEDIRTS